MKNLITALFITLASFTAKAQEQFNGMWQINGSDYICTILASEYAVIKVYNTSFKDCDVIDELILAQDANSFTSKLYNPDNGYTVEIKYTLINKDSISTQYSGHFSGPGTLTRLY